MLATLPPSSWPLPLPGLGCPASPRPAAARPGPWPRLSTWLRVKTSPTLPPMSEASAPIAGAVHEDDTLDLVAAALAPDGDHAFAELVRRHKPRITRLVARFARNPADLDELAQDVFLQAHRALHRYRGDAPLEHWLCRIATRRCQDYLRRLYRRRWFTSLDALLDSGYEPSPEPAPAADPRLDTLRLALRRLPPDQQTILTLLELEDHSVRDTALLTGLSEANVRVRAHRARHALRACFELLQHSASATSPRP